MKKKLLTLLLVVCATMCLCFGLSACGGKVHTHTYAESWTYDETYHWHAATCEHTGEVSEKNEHSFVDGICSICGYEQDAQPHEHTFSESWTSDATNHWHAATCEHTDEVSGKAAHNFANGICTICGYDNGTGGENPTHTHTYNQQVTTDTYLKSAATCMQKAEYYYSCTCGEKGTETFEYGELAGHNYENGVCTVCGAQKTSEGLAYTLSDDGTFYIVSGIGTCTDTDIVIPSTYNDLPVTEIGYRAFYCNSEDVLSYFYAPITSVVIPNGVTTIGGGAFCGCILLKNATIPDSVTEIGDEAFEGCVSLTSVTIGKSVTEIGDWAFSSCVKLIEVYNLSSLNITAGSEDNGYVAYYAKNVYTVDSGASKLTTTSDGYIFYDDTANGNGYYLMGYTGTETSLTLPDKYNGSNYSIYMGAFFFLTSLKSVVIPDSVTLIDEGAFGYCISLTSVTVGNDVTEIGDYAFSWCFSLTSVTIGKNVTSIGDEAFYYCMKLIEVSNLSSLNITAGSYDNGYVAYYAKNVYTADSGASKLTTTSDGYIFYDDTANNNGYNLIGYTKTGTSLTLPDNFNGNNYSIYPYAFAYCVSLTNVTIGNGVTTIGEGAFFYCTSLESVTIGNGVTEIGEGAFVYCTSLTSIIIPDSVTSIGYGAFEYCASLTSVTIGKGVTEIGYGAFYRCYRLIEVYNLSSLNITAGSSDNGYVAYYAKNVYTADSGASKLTTTDDGYIFYDDTADGNGYYLIGYKGTETALTLPDKYNGSNYSIYPYAFENCTSLKSVTIGNGVTSIGEGAFYGCSSLTSITIGNGVTEIGEDAFEDCTALTSIIIPDNVTYIGNGAFGYCTSLTSVAIGNGVTSIGNSAFYRCTSLMSVIIPNSVTSIGNSAFYRCTSLTSVTIGNSVTTIGEEAFYYCTSLTSIVIPDSVTEIGEDAFEYCTSLESVTIGNGVTEIGEGAFAGFTSLTSVTIGNSVTTIGNYAFYNCSSLTNIIIPDSVTEIGYGAFEYCASLTSVTIGNGVTEIGEDAFYGCTSLTEINYNATECADLSYDNKVFYYAGQSGDGITVTIGANVKKIPAYLFYSSSWSWDSSYAPKIVSVVFAENSQCASIGDYAFYGCSSLTSITIPDSMTEIGSSAFADCTALTEINYNATECADLSRSNYVFSYAGQSGEGITVTIGANVKKIPAYLFYPSYSSNSPKIVSVVFAENSQCTSIGNYAFFDCTSLTSITIPDGVTEIGSWAFEYCYKLIEVYNLSSLNITAGSYDNGYVAYYAKNVYTASSGASKLTTTSDGYIFYDDTENNNGYYLMGYTGTETALTLPDKYNGSNYSIYQYTFYQCASLTSVTIGSGVTSIGDYAFYGCTSLTSITVDENNNNYKSIDGNLYSKDGATLIQYAIGKTDASFTIPDGVTEIGYEAFYGCTSIESIVLPDSVTAIGDSAFYYCTSLTSIVIPDSVTSIGEYAFYGCTSLTYNEYDNAYYLGNDSNPYVVLVKAKSTIITSCTINEKTKFIYNRAFYNCTSLTSIVIPDSVTEIGNSAFYECTSLTSVTIGKSVTSIGSSAFRGCTSLTSVTIGNSVTSIGSYAFYNCTALTEINYNATECADLSNGNCVFSYAGQSGDGITVTIGANVKKIPAYLFYPYYDSYSPKIVSVVFAGNSQCASIGAYAFAYCTSLTRVYITDIAAWCGIEFGNSSSNPLSYAHNLYLNGELVTDLVIPDSVTEIGSYAFYNCTSLTSVTIGNGVTSIGSSAFRGCTSLTSITIPDSVTEIGEDAFRNCTSLTSVTFKNTSGWWRSQTSTATSGTSISSTDLANPATAAKYLTSTYCYYYWKRS